MPHISGHRHCGRNRDVETVSRPIWSARCMKWRRSKSLIVTDPSHRALDREAPWQLRLASRRRQHSADHARVYPAVSCANPSPVVGG